jgi:uncharacterized protein (TIGR02466 family)
MDFQLIKLFPKTIALYQLPYDKEEETFIKKFKYRETNDSVDNEKASKAFITSDLYVLDKNKKLKNKLFKYVNHFINDQLGFKFKTKITTSWITKTLPNGFSQDHSHTLSFYSGVYYPCKADFLYGIQFLEPENDFFQFSNYVSHFNHISSSSTLEVKNNVLILFNSKIKHKICKNKSNENRYSLAFNVMPTGLVGDPLSDSHYTF